MKKLILFVMGAVCVLSPCKGQHPSQNAAIDIPLSKIAALKIGDKVPDVVFRHMLNYKDSTARLSDFKGKPSIWALPKLYNLQTQFKEEFHILVVDNYDTPAKLKHFIKENPTGESIKLPFIVRDSILNRYFPYRFIPHEVWIDAFQRVVAITTSKYVNESNLKRLISGQKLNLPIKKDVKAKFDRNKPLLDDGNGGDINKLLFRSSLTEHLPGVLVSSCRPVPFMVATIRLLCTSIPHPRATTCSNSMLWSSLLFIWIQFYAKIAWVANNHPPVCQFYCHGCFVILFPPVIVSGCRQVMERAKLSDSHITFRLLTNEIEHFFLFRLRLLLCSVVCDLLFHDDKFYYARIYQSCQHLTRCICSNVYAKTPFSFVSVSTRVLFENI